MPMPEPEWERQTFDYVLDQIGEDTQQFLSFAGKSKNHWMLNETFITTSNRAKASKET
jgi:hypothetical protein